MVDASPLRTSLRITFGKQRPMDKRVKAIKHGQWRGQAFRPGDVTVMPELTAKVYAEIQQVEILGDAVQDEPAAIAAKPAVERPGPAVETAAKPAPERRRKK